MTGSNDTARAFEAERPRLRAIATRVTGSRDEAEDVVQEAWFRLERTGQSEISSLPAWLTVVVSRIALDHRRARASRREEPLESYVPAAGLPGSSAESAFLLEESVSEALAVALDRLSPLETAAFVLQDLFRIPADEVAGLLDRSPVATRKLASRARQKVADAPSPSGALEKKHRDIIEAFLSAARSGNLDRLIELLAPDAVLHADATTAEMGAKPEIVGARDVAERFSGGARVIHPAWLDGQPGAAWIHRGDVRVAFDFVLREGTIREIWLRSDPAYLAETEIEWEILPLAPELRSAPEPSREG